MKLTVVAGNDVVVDYALIWMLGCGMSNVQKRRPTSQAEGT